MKNESIYPVTLKNEFDEPVEVSSGLTKFEYMVTHIATGLSTHQNYSPWLIAKDSVEIATQIMHKIQTETIVLSKKDFDVMVDKINNSPKPNKALKKLMKKPKEKSQ